MRKEQILHKSLDDNCIGENRILSLETESAILEAMDIYAKGMQEHMDDISKIVRVTKIKSGDPVFIDGHGFKIFKVESVNESVAFINTHWWVELNKVTLVDKKLIESRIKQLETKLSELMGFIIDK